METMVSTQGRVGAIARDDDRAWSRVGRTAAYVAGAGFFLVTVLYLLDALNVLDPSPTFHATSAGILHDEANFWASLFAHQHRILWDIVLRDILGPFAFVALIVTAFAIRRLAGDGRPSPDLMVVFILVGGLIAALASLLYLGNVEVWRITGWNGQVAPASMVAIGRASAAIGDLSTWPEAVGYLLLAAGLAFLGRVAREGGVLPRRLGWLADVEAVLLVGLAGAGLLHADAARSDLSLVIGALIAPWLCLWLGRHLGRRLVGP